MKFGYILVCYDVGEKFFCVFIIDCYFFYVKNKIFFMFIMYFDVEVDKGFFGL